MKPEMVLDQCLHFAKSRSTSKPRAKVYRFVPINKPSVKVEML